MKFNRWTLGLAAAGVISLSSVLQAEEASKQVLTALSSTTLSGYIDTTASWKFGTGNANMPGRVYDGASPGYAQDGFNLNVVSLTLAKPLDEGQWSAGYNVQLLLGPGATKRGTGIIQSSAVGPNGVGVNNSLAFNEAYVVVRAPIGNGLDIKVGQFGTYNGYEAYDTYKNPNWSRSYGFFIESSAHTGVSASYKINDVISVMGGIANSGGYNNAVNGIGAIESKKAYLGMVTLTAPESMGSIKGATLSLGYTGGDALLTPAQGGAAGSWRQENLYAGLSLPLPITGLSVGLAYDYTAGALSAIATPRSSYANASALYVAYKATEKLTVNGRTDYATGSNGTFGYASAKAANLSNNELLSETVTVDYSLWDNVISRVELRWDHSLSSDRPFGGTAAGSAAFGIPGGAHNKNAVSVALNMIYKF